MNQFPTIESERLVLCQFASEDIQNVFKGLSHPDVINIMESVLKL